MVDDYDDEPRLEELAASDLADLLAFDGRIGPQLQRALATHTLDPHTLWDSTRQCGCVLGHAAVALGAPPDIPLLADSRAGDLVEAIWGPGGWVGLRPIESMILRRYGLEWLREELAHQMDSTPDTRALDPEGLRSE